MKIKNEKDFKYADSNLNIQKVSSDEIEIINVDDIWDGPLSGTCKWNSKNYYFYCFDQVEDTGEGDLWPRKYLLINLNPDQILKVNILEHSFKSWKKGLISDEQFNMIRANNLDSTLHKNQIAAWFDAWKSPNKFIDSYFRWQENQK